MNKNICYSVLLGLFVSMGSSAFAAESVPAKVPATASESAQVTSNAEVGLLNLNTADAASLQRELVGIGPVKAQAIVEYREAHGPFASVDELLEVKGIGAATLDKNRDKLTVN